jgi:hypothetical protein
MVEILNNPVPIVEETPVSPRLNFFRRAGVFLVFLIPLIYLSYLNRRYELDDALIYQRYVKNLLDGYGLVYNKNEYFNALTSPLFSYFSILASYSMKNLQLASVVLSTIFSGLALAMFTILFSRYENLFFVSLGALGNGSFPFAHRPQHLPV